MVLLLVVPSTGRARVRLESGPAVDTNVGRVEGNARTTDGLIRLVADVHGATRIGRRTAVSANYQAGAKRFFDETGEDMLCQSIDAAVAIRAAETLRLTADARVNDRTTRDPAASRDYTRMTAGVGVGWRRGSTRLTLRANGERFSYAPNPDQDARAGGTTLAVAHRIGVWTVEGHGGWTRRLYDGPLLQQAAVEESLPRIEVIGAPPEGERRRHDDLTRLVAGIRYGDRWIAGVDYAYARNVSNSFGGSYIRHGVHARSTIALPWSVMASAGASVFRVAYDEPQFVSYGGEDARESVEEENRSSFNVRLERPIFGDWSIVVHAGAWLSPAGDGPSYERRQLGLSFAYAADD